MRESLKQYILEKVALTNEELQHFVDEFEVIEIKKGDTLLRKNQYARYLYFIVKGTVRTYNEFKGKDITTWVYPEHIFVTSWYSFLENEPSREFIEVLEDGIVLAISNLKLEEMYDSHPGVERFGRLLVQDQLSFTEFYSMGYQFLSAKEKYELLLEIFPDITLRVKLGHVASLLGISNETLSRIRAGK